ncbi:6364_t:CDS:1, partial [Dentiscutata erythropus]
IEYLPLHHFERAHTHTQDSNRDSGHDYTLMGKAWNQTGWNKLS